MSAIFLIVGILFILSLIPLALFATRTHMRHRGTRVATCPETDSPAAVKLDVGHATRTGAVGETELRVRSCSGWPERQGCGQGCLEELASAPAECLIKTTLVEWYRRLDLRALRKGDRRGPLGGASAGAADAGPGDGRVERGIADGLPQILATHQRVCWSCHVSNALHERLPGLRIESETSTGPL